MRTTYQAAPGQSKSAAGGWDGTPVASTTSLARRSDLRPALMDGSPVQLCPHIEATDAVRVLIVEDHALVRDGLHALLSREPDIEVVGSTLGPDEAIDLAASLR